MAWSASPAHRPPPSRRSLPQKPPPLVRLLRMDDPVERPISMPWLIPARRRVDEPFVKQATLRLHMESRFSTGATPMQLDQIAQANRTCAKSRSGVIVARISAWTTLIFAIGTLLTSLTSLGGLILGVGMCIVSIIEFKGGTALKCLDRSAPK